ncbi:MAG: proton-conducting transporter membrane subunit [Candidatus Omnitrophica bacterium]|nr:proton-conducting transporter membrane subunit [Candidatus Omnitrophota bacterium]
MGNYIPLLITVPCIAALLILSIPGRVRFVREAIAVLAVTVNLIVTLILFRGNATFSMPWAGFGFEFILRMYHFSGFIVLATAGFGFLVTIYSTVFMNGKKYLGQFYAYLLLSVGATNGAVLADNLALMLFFWEGLLLFVFGMIAIGGKNAFKTATKSFIIVGISDLCMLAGIALAGYLCGTLKISAISLPVAGLSGVAFVLLVIGAISKAGSMPFHSWIPDAAIDAPLPFMAILPASLEKLLGIYFLARITLDMFKAIEGTWASMLLMIIGVITILLAVMMALIQKDYKKLLSYHAISQVGYMILGIGTMVPAGIIGGLFHMINHALYKSCLFLTGGSVERQAGTTDLTKLGGLLRKMPVTFTCFFIAAASISGVPPFNGFFSKELVYDGALERGFIFYAGALLGSFLTAASFLKLGHAAYLGTLREEHKGVKEAPLPMLVPMIAIASVCVFFGLWNSFPLRHFIQPILPAESGAPSLPIATGAPLSTGLVVMTLIALAAALLNHFYGYKKTGSGVKASDHIHYAPALRGIYDKAEQGILDPFNIGMHWAAFVSRVGWLCDRAIDWLYNVLIVQASLLIASGIRRLHNGSYKTYILWSLAGLVFVIYFLLRTV